MLSALVEGAQAKGITNVLNKPKPLPNGISQIIMRDGIRSLRNQDASPKPPDDIQLAANEPSPTPCLTIGEDCYKQKY
jgi:hypothetical protein